MVVQWPYLSGRILGVSHVINPGALGLIQETAVSPLNKHPLYLYFVKCKTFDCMDMSSWAQLPSEDQPYHVGVCSMYNYNM